MAGTENQSLFDQFERTDPSPMEHGGDVFAFYNRVTGSYWAQVRALLDQWYRDYPDTDGDLRRRFRSNRADQHLGAWWELYVYTFYRKHGYEVTVHPPLPHGGPERPDFLVTRDGICMYVECKMILEKPLTANEAFVLNFTNQVLHPDFVLGLNIEQVGGDRPGMSQVRTQLEAWLQSLSADDILEDIRRGAAPPALAVSISGWLLSYSALPLGPEQRGKVDRMLGMFTSSPGWQDNIGRIRKAVQEKGRKYARPETPLPCPLVLALNTATVFVEDEEIDRALYGSRWSTYDPATGQHVPGVGRLPDGYWQENPPRGTRVAAVMMGLNISPHRVATANPRMWVNPWAPAPIATTHSLATTTLAEDERDVLRAESGLAVSDLFGLPAGWPQA